MNVVSPVAINVPVTDINRALDLYRDCLGFSTLADRGSGALREVTMLAPGGAVAIQLAQGNHARPAGGRAGEPGGLVA